MAVNDPEYGRLIAKRGKAQLEMQLSNRRDYVTKNETMNRLAGMDSKEASNNIEYRKLLEEHSKENLDNKLLAMRNFRCRGADKLRLLHAEKDDRGKFVHGRKMSIKGYKEKAEKLLLSGEKYYKFTCVNYPNVVKTAKRDGWANRTNGQLTQCCPNCHQHKVPRNQVFGESGKLKTWWWIVEK